MISSPTCRLITLGCKVNQYESQFVKEALEQNGYREAADEEAADLCSQIVGIFRDHGSRESRTRARLCFLIQDRGVAWFRAELGVYSESPP